MQVHRFFLTIMFLLMANLFGQDLARAQENSWPTVDLKQRFARKDKKLKTMQSSIPTRLGALQVEIHFPLHSYRWALNVLSILHQDAARLVDYFDWLPKDAVHFTLIHDAKSANGFAAAFPRNRVGLFSHPPTGREHLSSNSDFQRALVLHELTHILHMDQSRGFPKAVRSVFGSVGKWNGITPRWFSEGVAVWAETHFTSGGRLRDRALDYQLKSALLKEDACRDIGCLDNPNHYPYQSLPYWAGAYFISFIEEQQAGSVRCLLAQNSRSIPFFLNDAFRSCTGATAEQLYFRFTQNYLTTKADDPKGVRVLDLGQSHLMLEAGSFLNDDLFVHLQRTDKDTELVIWDVIKNQEIKRWRHEYPISKIVDPSNYDREKNRFIFGAKSYHNEGEVQRWFGVNIENFAVEPIKFPGGATEIFRLSDQLFAGLIFSKNRWEIRLWDRSKSDKENLSLRYQFPQGMDLFYPKMKKSASGKDALVVQTHFQKKNALLEIELETKTYPKTIYETDEYFQLLEVEGEMIAVFQKGEVKFVGEKLVGIPATYNDQISALWWREVDQNKGVALFTDNQSPGKIKLALLPQKNQATKTALDFKAQKSPAPSHIIKNEDLLSYPGLRHFKPHYWAFGFGGNEYLTRYDASTSLNDPFDRHTLALNASSYSEINKNGGAASYTFNANDYLTSTFYEKSYTVRGAGRSIDTFESYGLSLGKSTTLSRWSYLPVIYANQQSIDDFISSRESQSYGIRQNFSTQGLFYDSFWQLSVFQMHHYRQKTQGFKEFPAHSYKWENSFRLFEPLMFHTTYAFSQLLKKGLRSGVLYGGGSEALYNLGGFHEFYGLEYGDLISNRITTARAQFDARLYESYKGSGFNPFYLKSINMLLGAEYAHSSNIFLDGRFIQANNVMSYHAGLSFKMDVFYNIPLNVDTIYAQVQNPEGANQTRFLFLLRGQIFP